MKCIHWRKLPFHGRGLFQGSTIVTTRSSRANCTSQARLKVKQALEEWVREEAQYNAVEGLSGLDSMQRNSEVIMNPSVGIEGC